MNFNELGLKPAILSAVDKMWYKTPTKIQEEVILASVSWGNIIGQSQTWTGKTAAFVISILQNIDLSKKGIKALILAPTRELVTQIKEEIFNLSSNMRIRSLAVYGGEPIYKQLKMLAKWQDIIVGTPWRVIDLIDRKALRLEDVENFVLDEVDRMLDMGFVDDIELIWGNLGSVKQTYFFSATITQEIKSIVEKHLWVDYTFIKATNELTVAKIDHSFVEVPNMDKFEMLKRFIKKHMSEKTIVFVDTKRDTELLAKKLNDEWFAASYLNWDMRQRERFRALKDFQENKTKIFVVTDVAARWLNIKNIDLVVNYHVPQDPESYIHRIGRTWRAWAEGRAIMMVSNDEKFAFRNIEKRNKIRIKQVDVHWEELERKEETKSNGEWSWKRMYNRFEKGRKRSFGRWAESDRRWWSGFGRSRRTDDQRWGFEDRRWFEEKRSFQRNSTSESPNYRGASGRHPRAEAFSKWWRWPRWQDFNPSARRDREQVDYSDIWWFWRVEERAVSYVRRDMNWNDQRFSRDFSSKRPSSWRWTFWEKRKSDDFFKEKWIRPLSDSFSDLKRSASKPQDPAKKDFLDKKWNKKPFKRKMLER